jgi:hypothetical protein
MGMGRRAVAWVIWGCKRFAYLPIDRYERPRRETAGAFLLAINPASSPRQVRAGRSQVEQFDEPIQFIML